MTWYIYCLRCPLDNLVRYVGCTADPKRREGAYILGMRSHISNQSLYNWLEALLEQSQFPVFEILEQSSDVAIHSKLERKWIDKLKAEGHPLLNVPDSERIKPWTDEMRRKQSKLMRAGRAAQQARDQHRQHPGASTAHFEAWRANLSQKKKDMISYMLSEATKATWRRRHAAKAAGDPNWRKVS